MTDTAPYRGTEDRAADLWRELFPHRFPAHWDAIVALLGQNETFTLLTLLSGYKQAAHALFEPGDMVSVKKPLLRHLESTSGWYPYRRTLAVQVGTVRSVGFNPHHGYWAAEVQYDHPEIIGSDDRTYYKDEPAVFHIPVGDLQLLGATKPPAGGDAAWDGGTA